LQGNMDACLLSAVQKPESMLHSVLMSL